MSTNPQPFNTGLLPTTDHHQIYFSQYGNPSGPAIVRPHGGPGEKSKPKLASSFDLKKFHVITFDQRGCGQSTPQGEIKHNTTTDLIADMEKIRQHLQIKKWFVAGGSWGSTLALAYAQAHPAQVKGLLLSSIFLAREKDLQWACTQPTALVNIFPDLWEKNRRFLNKFQTKPASAAQDLLKIMSKADFSTQQEIAAGVSNWENNLMYAQADLSFTDPTDIDENDIASAKIFLHYEANNFFLKENQLLNNMDKITHIPAVLVHGRYDLLCPLEQMWELQKKFKQVQTIILPTSNHLLTADGRVAKNQAYGWFLEKQV